MRIYLDVSCLNRPFDDQRQVRIRLEAEAITVILNAVDTGRWTHVSSTMAETEIAAIGDVDRRRRVHALLPSRGDIITVDDAILGRATQLTRHGFKPADAAHIAAAEAGKADVLLSCDDRMCRLARRKAAFLRIAVANPLDWLIRYGDDDDTGRNPRSGT